MFLICFPHPRNFPQFDSDLVVELESGSHSSPYFVKVFEFEESSFEERLVLEVPHGLLQQVLSRYPNLLSHQSDVQGLFVLLSQISQRPGRPELNGSEQLYPSGKWEQKGVRLSQIAAPLRQHPSTNSQRVLQLPYQQSI